MKEYKMRRGETLDERLPDLEGTVEEYFGPITDTEERDGHELFVVDDPKNPVFKRILVGSGRYSSKKDTIVIEFEERPPDEVLDDGLAEAASEAIDMKNEFLLEATGRDAEARRKSMKRQVEDEAPDIQ